MKTRFALSTIALAVLLPLATPSWSAVDIAVNFGPPPLPVYEQPMIPGDGYIWTPGYWAWDEDYGDYYWVPGTWVMAPRPNYLWTPAWWGWEGAVFRFHQGYWGPHIGFYGGINYGFGYTGSGYYGGRWERGHFMYNTAVNNVNVRIVRNVYNVKVVNNYNVPRTSFNGGNGGVQARPTAIEERAEHDRNRIEPTQHQIEQIRTAKTTPELRAGANHGAPPIAATQRPNEFKGNAVVRARNEPTVSGPPPKADRPGSPENRPTTGSPERDRPNAKDRPAGGQRDAAGNEPVSGGGDRDRPDANKPDTTNARPAPGAQPGAQPAPTPRPVTRPGQNPTQGQANQPGQPQAQPNAGDNRGQRPNRDGRDQPNQRYPQTPPQAQPQPAQGHPAPTPTPPAPTAKPEPVPAPQAQPQPKPEPQAQPQPQPRNERRAPPEEQKKKKDEKNPNER